MKKLFLLPFALLAGTIFAHAQQKDTTAKKEGYVFTDIKRLPVTNVKSQDRAGTCWAWSMTSFLESEMMRRGKDSVSLSPMFIVWNTYDAKADRYVRLHGSMNFGQGGSGSDVLWAIRERGIVPLETYKGLNYGEDVHVHGEMDKVMKAYLDAVVSNPNRKLSTAWKRGFTGIEDAYLGEVPAKFTWKGKEYTPETFAKDATGLDMDDYVSLTSYTHHPFYTRFAIEVPDNWMNDQSYNIPLDELMSVLDKAIDNGYSFFWGTDVSEAGFSRNGLAVVPVADTKDMTDAEIAKWVKLPKAQQTAQLMKKPGKEKEITQELRQKEYDNYQTTDDHGMHVMGKAVDQLGNKYFIVKNSWGKYGDYEGYLYASYPFVAYKTMNVIIHKDALPKDLRKKLGIK